jgi:uncharacterized protein (TIGR01777 family)
MTKTFEYSSELPASAANAYNWHARPGAFERLLPPWDQTRIVEQHGTIEQGRVVLEVPFGPFRQHWVVEHHDGKVGLEFSDRQIEGPFQSWEHTHRFDSLGPTRSRLVDHIHYQLPFGGEIAAGTVEHRLSRTFRYRHRTLNDDLGALNLYGPPAVRTIAITGATGLIGQALIPFLTAAGHRVRKVTRGRTGPEDINWDPAAGRLDPASLEGVDAVIHLAGESIAGARWTEEQRRKILESRIQGTTLLAETLATLRRRPKVLISASAIGIYGDRGQETLTERSGIRTGPGTFFVERVGHAWEAATEPAERAGIRVARTRFGIILTPAGGALPEMMRPFLLGLGGRLGTGAQYMSWIGVDDVIGAIYHALMIESLDGPVNVTAPTPVTNAEFSTTLARVLRRPALFPVPPAALRLVVGEMADELLLASARVIPERLRESGYRFRFTDLEETLRHVLGR